MDRALTRLSWNRARAVRLADALAVAVALSLPWSTSAASILIVLWLIALIPTLSWPEVRSELMTAAGGLPVLLALLGVVGMIWADVSLADRLGGLTGFAKLSVIPLLMAQFRRSGNGYRVFTAFLIACILLLIASVVVEFWPTIPHGSQDSGVAVKNYIVQSLEFAICAAVLAHIAVDHARARRWVVSAGLLLLAFAFLADIAFIATGRTTLVILPVLAFVYGVREYGWKGFVAAVLLCLVAGAAVWSTSPYLRQRAGGVVTETERFERHNANTSSGERIVFWTRSLQFIADAPVIGHGTGSITPLFSRAAAGYTGAKGERSTNPHNQTFAVGIQLGAIGIAVLWLMWAAQLAMLRGAGLIAWIGLVVVVSNIVGSLFNSFIFDFTEGWLYVFGFGIAAGMLRKGFSPGGKT